MKSNCLICGREISTGFLCDKCDKPRRSPAPKTDPAAQALPESDKVAATPAAEIAPPPMAAAPPPSPSPRTEMPPVERGGALPDVAFEPFPKAPVLPFPVESTSLAITSVCDVLTAANVASVLVGADKNIRFLSEDAQNILGISSPERQLRLAAIETKIGISIPDLTQPTSSLVKINDRLVRFSIVPLSGNAGGAVLMFRPQDPFPDQTPFAAYVRETVLMPLRALHESLSAAIATRAGDALLEDMTGTIDQILSSLELASNIEEPPRRRSKALTVSQIVAAAGDLWRPRGEKRGVTLQIDMPEISDAFRDQERLSQSLNILLENAVHYVPDGGQIVLGARMMEHKEKPLLLFFVMDNGPVVPEEYRRLIFDSGFAWDPADPVRSGGNLGRVRQFASDHGGQVSVESKSGKACTFFLRVRPDT